MAKGPAHVSDGDATRIDPKRSHNWFVDAEPQLFPNKKQAIQAANNKSSSGVSNSNVPPWENVSSFQSVPSQFIDRLFSSESERSVHFSWENNSDMSAIELYNGGNGSSFISMGHDYDKRCDNVAVMSHTYNRDDLHITTATAAYDKDNEIPISIANTYVKEDANILSFGGFHEEHEIIPVGRPLGSFDPSYCQSSNPTSEDTSRKHPDVPIAGSDANATPMSKLRPESSSRTKPELKSSKKETPNSFPSNVRSLISTGMLDGVPVKYISLSREELCGVIKGSGYLCGCQSCNFSKVLNAYEFERHAGCKTKHPNNHIYFENGKTIYQIVQELRSTPESLLFDTIQTVFGAPINQKSFRIWKESFQAATRELQRIYGKELNL
ncbi:HopZ1a Interactor 1 [Hibiscus trionum]|uniref:HopZ1a Interactor 1 n=1 Tax=Hibiscus trionum TaxID=183268 RepID=A0A9W7ICT4_HIBTR|nr:HopZ1a Interactor 1 [Hibiscus trionum]